MWFKTAVGRFFFPLQTANVAYFQIKIHLSGFSAYRFGSTSQLTFWHRSSTFNSNKSPT
jgi:hypothetical protein